MKILILTVTILNFVAYFPYNWSQEIHSQTNQHLSGNPPLSSLDSHTASQFSSILRTKENSAPTDNSNRDSESTDTITRLSGSFSKRNSSETLQASIQNLLSFGDDAASNLSTNRTSASFAYVEGTADSSTQAEAPKSNASPSSAVMQDTPAVSTTISRFVPNSSITQSRMTVSGENNILAPVSTTTHQYKADSIAIPHFQTDHKATWNPEPFFPSTGRSKPFFAPNPAAYVQNTKNEFSDSADESAIAISNTNKLLGTYTTTHEEEAGPESVSFIGTSLVKEGNTAKIDATAKIDYTTLLGVPDMKDKNIIILDTTYLERYGKTASNAPDLPQKDNSIVIDATDMKKHSRTTVNAQKPSISSAKNSNDFESTPNLSTYKTDTKSIMIASNIDETISNINPINTTNSFLNYRVYKKSNNVISDSNDTKTMLDIDKNTTHVGDFISKTNGITSTKHYANPNPIDPMTTTDINFKITWPSKEGVIIEGRHTVQVENITTPNNNNIAEASASKVNDSKIKYHSIIPANVHLKTDRNNFKTVSTNGIENVIPVVQEITNMDQDDAVVEEVIFIHPDTSTTEIRRKAYSLNPNAEYVQTAGNKIILSSYTPDIFNPLFRYQIKPFTTNSTKLINNKGDQRISTTITANDPKDKMDVERTIVLKTADFQSNITPMVSIAHPGTAGSVYFSEDSVADMTSASKVSITPSDKSTDSVDEIISLSINNNHADDGAGPNPETDFPMNKEYTVLSVAKSSTLTPNAQNNQAQNSLLIKDDSLTGAWVSDPVVENPRLVNDAIIQKWKINTVSADPLNIPLASTFLIAGFTSPNDEYNATSSARKGITNMTDSPERMTNKATMQEGRPTIAISSLPTKTVSILTPRKSFGSLIDKGMANEEESTPHLVEEDDVFQIKENLPPAHNFKYIESRDSGFERKGFVATDTTKSLSQLSNIVPTAEVTITDRDLIIPGEDNVDVLYDVTKPANDKIHFKTMATKKIVNGLRESAAVTQNVEAPDVTEFLPFSNSFLQTGRTDHPIPPNLYYNVITDNPLTITKKNPNVAQNIRKHKLSLSTMEDVDLIDYRNSYQTPAAIASSNAKRLANKGQTAETEMTNIPLDIATVADDIFYVDKNTEVVTDLASIAATSPTKKGILTMNEVNTLNNKPNKLGDDFTISRDDPNVSRDDGTLLIADSSTFMKSVSPFNHPQATNPVKKTSLADIVIPKTFHYKSTPAALTVAVTAASQGDTDAMLYIPRYESENSFKEAIIFNYEADPKNTIGITAEEEDIVKEENVKDHIYVIPIAGDNVPKGNNLAAKHYSLNSDIYNSNRSKETSKTTSEQPKFENPASSNTAEVSKPLLGKFTPEFQGKLMIRNSNSGAEHDAFFGGNSLYPMMEENVSKGYIFSPERRSTFTTPDFRIPMRDNINSALESTVLLDKGTSSKNYASSTDEQTDPRAEKDQIATGSIINSHTGTIPMTFSIPLSSEDINVENYYHTSGIHTPLSLGYTNTLRDDSFILRPGTTAAKENNLDAMDLIIEPDKSDSEYISNKLAFELKKKENSPIKKPIQCTRGPDGFVSHTPPSKGEDSKSFLYRVTHPEFETKDKYQTIILKGENSDSDVVATSFKDYTKNLNTQHLNTMVHSPIDAGETFSPEFLERSSVGKGTLSEDDAIIILPEVSDLGNKKIKYLSVPHTETIVTVGESRTFGSAPSDHAVITTSIKRQGHFYRKGIPSSVPNTAALELAGTITLEKSKVNENKMDSAGMIPSEDHINPLTQDLSSQDENIFYVGEVTKGIIKTDSIGSLNPSKATEMPTNVTPILPNASAFDSKKSNENGDSTVPEVGGVLSKKLKSLLIPNQKGLRTAVTLSENDDSLSDKSVTLEVSESLGEHSTISDQNCEVIRVQNDPQPFSVVSSVPLEDHTTFSENPITVVTDHF